MNFREKIYNTIKLQKSKDFDWEDIQESFKELYNEGANGYKIETYLHHWERKGIIVRTSYSRPIESNGECECLYRLSRPVEIARARCEKYAH